MEARLLWRWYGDAHPVVGFRGRHGGEEGVIAARSIIGFSPVEVAEDEVLGFTAQEDT